jgi:hypothetical protein
MAFTVSAVPTAHAAMCIVDYDTFEVRADFLPSDHETMATEQTGFLQDWYVNGTPINVMGTTYEKYGLLRLVSAADLAFHAFQGSVPVMKAVGDGEVPEMVYVLVRPEACEVQGYAIAASAAPSGTKPPGGATQFD